MMFVVGSAAGLVDIHAAVLIGIAAGGVCYLAVAMKNKLKWDDALDVWGVHGVGGLFGVICPGLFAQTAINNAPGVGVNGLFYGNSSFFFKQLGAIVFSSVYAFLFTYVMLVIIDKITPVRVKPGDEANGLDATLHGEVAYEMA
jgi:ammonium transporter, Amt family